MKNKLLALIKRCSFSIGDLNGKFGLAFWDVTSFSIRLRIGKYSLGFGAWHLDKSDPKRYPYCNKVGWEVHWYRKVQDNPRVWKPSWANYYGFTFGIPWFFMYLIHTLEPGASADFDMMDDTIKKLQDKRDWYRANDSDDFWLSAGDSGFENKVTICPRH